MSSPGVVILGPGVGRRILQFLEAARRAGIRNVPVVGYADFARNPERLVKLLGPGAWLRFESPDEDASAFRALYEAGKVKAETLGYPVLSDRDLDAACAGSAIGSPAQLAFGLQELTGRAARIARDRGALVSADPDEIALCYDKRGCNAHLGRNRIPTPESLDLPEHFDALLAGLEGLPGRRAFVKLNHGAGAAGTLAIAAGPRGQIVAYTAKVRTDAAVYTTKRVRRCTDIAEIRDLFQAILPLGLHVERWLPKAGIDGRTVDLRLVSTRSGKPFAVLRMSRSPITNLHLDAERAPAERLFSQMQPSAVQSLLQTANRTMCCFPGTAMLGLDIAVHTDLNRHSVLEVNAFGDHVRNVWIDGETPQDRQIRDMQTRMAHAH